VGEPDASAAARASPAKFAARTVSPMLVYATDFM
jgi:hypothetical protein